MKKYYEIKRANSNAGITATHIKVETYYDLGGINYFTYRTEPRGYYMMVVPVEKKTYDIGVTMEGYASFSGAKHLLKKVKRKSAKAEAEAEAIAQKKLKAMIEYVCRENGIELTEAIA